MGSIVALASYPKSGNTWLRAFLASVQTGGAPVDINRLLVPNAADCASYDRALGIDSSDCTVEELYDWSPMVHAHLSARRKSRKLS